MSERVKQWACMHQNMEQNFLRRCIFWSTKVHCSSWSCNNLNANNYFHFYFSLHLLIQTTKMQKHTIWNGASKCVLNIMISDLTHFVHLHLSLQITTFTHNKNYNNYVWKSWSVNSSASARIEPDHIQLCLLCSYLHTYFVMPSESLGLESRVFCCFRLG